MVHCLFMKLPHEALRKELKPSAKKPMIPSTSTFRMAQVRHAALFVCCFVWFLQRCCIVCGCFLFVVFARKHCPSHRCCQRKNWSYRRLDGFQTRCVRARERECVCVCVCV